MKLNLGSVYRCPGTGESLSLKSEILEGDQVISGSLVSASGTSFPIEGGVPNLVWPQQLAQTDENVRAFYDGRADVYDQYLPLTFATFREDEAQTRNAMIDLLMLKPDHRVLEIGAGTGRDSEIIAS